MVLGMFSKLVYQIVIITYFFNDATGICDLQYLLALQFVY